MLDRLKDMGFTWATKAGISIGITDMIIPTEKQVELDSAYKQIAEVDKQYRRGIITMASVTIRSSISGPRW
jgi:DNA-directed RNA polymerase subunit beta'